MDPGLLLSLHVLLQEGSVTAASRRLGITQSSMSHRLRLLREELADELFVRDGRRLAPTPRALALAPRLDAAFRELAAAAAPPPEFQPDRDPLDITLLLPDLLAPVIPPLVAALQAAAPRTCITIVPFDRSAVATPGDSRSLAIGPSHLLGNDWVAKPLRAQTLAVAARNGHPAMANKRLTVDRWLAYPHITVRMGLPGPNLVDDTLARSGRTRMVGLEVPSFLTALHALRETDAFLAVPLPLSGDVLRALGLRTWPAPIRLPTPKLSLLWHPRWKDDGPHKWLREFTHRQLTSLLGGHAISAASSK